jgi:predicted Zn-dependent protease
MLWMGSALLSVWRGGGNPTPPQPASAEGLFLRALSEYLQGSWFEAESLLGQLLHIHPRDAEARLMLATLLRRTGRSQEALAQLARLELLRDSEKWRLEIASERERLAAAMAAEPPVEPGPANETTPSYVLRQAA